MKFFYVGQLMAIMLIFVSKPGEEQRDGKTDVCKSRSAYADIPFGLHSVGRRRHSSFTVLGTHRVDLDIPFTLHT
jgi:hypothetical protein